MNIRNIDQTWFNGLSKSELEELRTITSTRLHELAERERDAQILTDPLERREIIRQTVADMAVRITQSSTSEKRTGWGGFHTSFLTQHADTLLGGITLEELDSTPGFRETIKQLESKLDITISPEQGVHGLGYGREDNVTLNVSFNDAKPNPHISAAIQRALERNR